MTDSVQIIDSGTPLIEDVTDQYVPVNIPDNLTPANIPNTPMSFDTDEERYLYDLDLSRARMYAPTSMADIKYMLNDKIKVVVYDELQQYNTLDELLQPYMAVVILYPNFHDKQCGHWCCCFVNTSGHRVEFFDSYGSYIDEKIADFDKEVESQRGDTFHQPKKIEPKLLELIYNSPYQNIVFNHVTYQCQKIDTNTCGLWVVWRLKNRQHTEDDFQKMFLDLPVAEGFLPDLVISNITNEVFPEMRPKI